MIQLINGSSYNNIQFCTINGVTASTKGVINFSTSNGVTGNSNNIIAFNDFTSGATTPNNIIASNGTTLKNNSNNIIRYNLIHDFFSSTADCNGIVLNGFSDGWVIKGNSFYETAIRNFTSNLRTWNAINLNNRSSVFNTDISDNFIGGDAANCSGGPLTITGVGKMQVIKINAGPGAGTSIQGNTISNISFATTSSTYISIISHSNGLLDMGNISPNIIGNQNYASIVFNVSGGAAASPTPVNIIDLGLLANNTGKVNIVNNKVGGIQITGSGCGRMRIVELNGAAFDYTISNNIFGGTNANSIENMTNGAITGVYSASSASVDSIVSNTFRNFATSSVTSTESVTGAIYMQNRGATLFGSQYIVSGNQIYNLVSVSSKPSTSGCYGIFMGVNFLTDHIIANNLIYNLLCNTTGFNGNIGGIRIAAGSGTTTCSNNFIHSLSASSGNYTISGINMAGGTSYINNNIIRLGLDESGINLSQNHIFSGISENAGNSNFIYNTVYIGGTNSSGNALSAGFMGTGAGVRIFLNNAFVNARSNSAANNYSLYLSSLVNVQSDNNNLYATGTNGKTGFTNSTTYSTLATWKAGSGKDALSVAGDPLFVNATGNAIATNFNIQQNSASDNKGTFNSPANSILIDYAGNLRNIATPDIGAFEFSSSGNWTGLVSTDWNDPANWGGNTLPDLSTDVFIAAGQNINVNNLPVIGTGETGYARNLTLQLATTSLDVTGTGSLKVAGQITNAGTLSLEHGTLELNGSSLQTIGGSLFENHIIGNLIISNNVNISSLATDSLKISGTLTFGNVNNKTLGSGNNITLISDGSGTASIGDLTYGGITAGNSISGNVIVERFIPLHSKAWQFLCSPVVGQTLKNAWQEGASSVASNPYPGYGTTFTSKLASALSLGFDFYTPSSNSITVYDSPSGTWDGISSMSVPVGNQKGYFIFVRGDRSVTAYNQPATAVTLRSSGAIYQPTNPPSVINVGAGKFETISNPYASALDFSKILRTGGVADLFYVWDPTISGQYGYGGWQTITSNAPNPGYTVTPGGGNYANGRINIQSGQAFMVSAPLSSGSLTFNEGSKVTGSDIVTRSAGNYKQLSINLTTSDQSVLLDGVLTRFDNSFSDSINEYDARKVKTGSESIGILKSNHLFVVENRGELRAQDSIQLLTENLHARDYQLIINPSKVYFPGRTAFIEDKYLHKDVPLNLENSSLYSFIVNNEPASSATDRFSIKFRQAVSLPVLFRYIEAVRKNNETVQVNWGIEHELEITKYDIESSSDGLTFKLVSSENPSTNNAGAGNYISLDNKGGKSSFYRVKAVNTNGGIITSPIVMVKNSEKFRSISIFPNPVENKKMNISFASVEQGVYTVILYDFLEKVYERTFELTDVNLIKTVDLPKSLSGSYNIVILHNNSILFSQSVIVK